MTKNDIGCIRSKLQVALYLLVRPNYLPDLLRRVRINIGKSLLPQPIGCSARIATDWAAERAVSVEDALEEFGASPRSLNADFPTEIAYALKRETEVIENKGWGGSADLIYSVCEAIGAHYAIETGVAHGFSSLAILLSVTSRGGHLYSVDMPAPGRGSQNPVGIVVPDHLRRDWTLEQFPDSIGLRRVLRKSPPIDFCHYDSDKSYEGRCLSYPLLWSKLRPGGVFMSDDIADNTAFRDFAAEVGVQPIVVFAEGSGVSGARYVGLMKKTFPDMFNEK